jgi:hypothetical protein
MRNQRRAQKAASTGEVQVDSIVVRPLVAADAELIDAMHQRLSPESVYYRYIYTKKGYDYVNLATRSNVLSVTPNGDGCAA